MDSALAMHVNKLCAVFFGFILGIIGFQETGSVVAKCWLKNTNHKNEPNRIDMLIVHS